MLLSVLWWANHLRRKNKTTTTMKTIYSYIIHKHLYTLSQVSRVYVDCTCEFSINLTNTTQKCCTAYQIIDANALCWKCKSDGISWERAENASACRDLLWFIAIRHALPEKHSVLWKRWNFYLFGVRFFFSFLGECVCLRGYGYICICVFVYLFFCCPYCLCMQGMFNVWGACDRNPTGNRWVRCFGGDVDAVVLLRITKRYRVAYSRSAYLKNVLLARAFRAELYCVIPVARLHVIVLVWCSR